ncbi:PREDICTED: uncharacterized protein LOC104809452 [Tarenaya hassleriana]|uniref:uncharacterized protein LOC104809452 n=1 Tax=Tarenaya hassleriana TaxID=28532 RepID=UPI00053C45E9|nr:PREDICTED: uncharacterized protein LOC104809452 [Tarenaya hassleriana]
MSEKPKEEVVTQPEAEVIPPTPLKRSKRKVADGPTKRSPYVDPVSSGPPAKRTRSHAYPGRGKGRGKVTINTSQKEVEVAEVAEDSTEKDVVSEKEYVWNPERIHSSGKFLIRNQTFVECDGPRATSLWEFMKKPEEKRLWKSRLNVEREPSFWETLLEVGLWLTDIHMDEAMYELRTRVIKNPVTFIGFNYLVCDTMFVELINTWAESGDMTTVGDLQPYFNGRLPIGCAGTPLISYEGFVSVLNVLGFGNDEISCNWIAIKVDFSEKTLEIYDCQARLQEKAKEAVQTLCHAVPKLCCLAGSEAFADGDVLDIEYVQDVPQNNGEECGVFAVKYIEAICLAKEHMLLPLICNDNVTLIREQLAAAIFANGKPQRFRKKRE